MKKVIVIGANGFIGSHLTQRLVDNGYQVIAFVARGFDYSHVLCMKGVKCLEFELSKMNEYDGNKDIINADILFHMAWVGVSSDLKNDAQTQASNILYGLNVLEFAFRNDIKRVIVPGSASEYSCSDGVIDGNNIPAPADLYSACKVATRYLCQTFAIQKNIDLIWTAITSIYGPGRHDNNLITYAITTLLKGEKTSFTGLQQYWDYLYIDDLITALILIGEKGKRGSIYPIGTGDSKKMSEYVHILRDEINPSLPIGIGELPYKNNKIDNQIIDVSKLKLDTGFNPKYSFEEGIKKTIDYFKEQLKSSLL